MGWAARSNPNSKWNKDRAGKMSLPDAVQVASPITTAPKNFAKAPTPAKQGELMVMELTLQNIWGSLCRMLKSALRFQSPAQTS